MSGNLGAVFAIENGSVETQRFKEGATRAWRFGTNFTSYSFSPQKQRGLRRKRLNIKTGRKKVNNSSPSLLIPELDDIK